MFKFKDNDKNKMKSHFEQTVGQIKQFEDQNKTKKN